MAELIRSKKAFARALHAWYRAHRRKLPWRESPSLYRTVVSEFMLQQTRVATMLPSFDRWLCVLPDFAALAAAPAARVLKLWEGLGYYSRARRLHQLARAIVARPAPPRTPQEWSELPGVGPYTAAAITSIAFGAPVACVDGNVVRVLARLAGENRQFRDGSAAARFFAPLAASLVGGADPGRHNQAMMELGATVCRRKKPRCLECPVRKYCAARRGGDPEGFPRLRPRQIERRDVARAWCEHAGRLLLRRTDAKAGRLAGLHELPETRDLGFQPSPEGIDGRPGRGDPRGLRPGNAGSGLPAPTGGKANSLVPAGNSLMATRRRTITRFQITESIHRVAPTVAVRQHIAKDPALAWVPLAGVDRLTLSGPHKRWIRELLEL